jgi:release factor glutamine methyltransferase
MKGQQEIASADTATIVRHLLGWGAEFLSQIGVESARLDAELLLGHILGWSRERLWLNHELSVEATQREQFEHALRRRAQREPVAYITGVREFWSLDFCVTPEVLIPRPETELLVELALRGMRPHKVPGLRLRVIDLGTGAGAIAVSLAKECENVEVWATDLSLGALKVAEGNARRHKVEDRIRFLQGDLFEPVMEAKNSFDMIISNPPYVRRNEIKDLPPDVREWEPLLALDGGADGLDVYRRIIKEGAVYLKDGGSMLLEIGADMGNDVSRLFEGNGGYSDISVNADYAGKFRVAVARKRILRGGS